MSRKSLYSSEIDLAIMKALRDSTKQLRYNELHRKASDVFGNRIWIKTFNDHLKRLCENNEVIRNENTRYNVTYEPARKYTAEERRAIELEKNLLDYALNVAARVPDYKLRKDLIQGKIRYVIRRRFLMLKILTAILGFATGEEKKAKKMIDEAFYNWRILIDHFIEKAAKLDGIDQIVKEMIEGEKQDIKEKTQKIDGAINRLSLIRQELDKTTRRVSKLTREIKQTTNAQLKRTKTKEVEKLRNREKTFKQEAYMLSRKLSKLFKEVR